MAITLTGLGVTAPKSFQASQAWLQPRTESNHLYANWKGLLSCIKHPRECLSWISWLAAFRPRGYLTSWYFLPGRLKKLLQKLGPSCPFSCPSSPALGQVLHHNTELLAALLEAHNKTPKASKFRAPTLSTAYGPQLLCLTALVNQTQTWHPVGLPHYSWLCCWFTSASLVLYI